MPTHRARFSTPRVSSAKKDSIPIGPWLLFGALCALLGGGYWFANKQRSPLDQATLCRTDQAPPSVTVLLLDVSDAISLNEQEQILSEVERIRATVPRFGLIELYELGSEPSAPSRPTLSICNPGRGAEVSEIYQNPTIVEERWRNAFKTRLDDALDSVVSGPASDRSLIMESIRGISIAPFGKPRFDNASKSLFVFSDFLQNAPGAYSQYRRPLPDSGAFARSDYASSVRANLTGVSVGLFYIDRPGTHAIQDGEHQRFWVDYFEASGAEVERLKRILGD